MSEIKELERRIELKEQEIFLMIEEKMRELDELNKRLSDLRSAVHN